MKQMKKRSAVSMHLDVGLHVAWQYRIVILDYTIIVKLFGYKIPCRKQMDDLDRSFYDIKKRSKEFLKGWIPKVY